MNAAIRCDVKDQFGHRCSRKTGHTKIVPSESRPKDIRNHAAFGREWPPVDPITAHRPKGKKKRHSEGTTV